jgi:RNA polymerase sigma factor (sigma-70 family)
MASTQPDSPDDVDRFAQGRSLNRQLFRADAVGMTGERSDASGGAELVDAVRSGDEETFGALFDAAADDVYRFCVRRVSDPELAEDLVSVVFLEAWRCRRRAFVVDESLRPWLFGIARNVTRTARRSAFRHRAALTRYHAIHDGEVEQDPADQVAGRIDAERAHDVVEAAVSGLPRKDRDVAELCLLVGLTTAAAAVVLGIPEGTVRSRLSRVRRRLRRLLQSGEDVNGRTGTGHEPVERPPAVPSGRS